MGAPTSHGIGSRIRLAAGVLAVTGGLLATPMAAARQAPSDAPIWLEQFPRPVSRANAATWYRRAMEEGLEIARSDRMAIADWDGQGPPPPNIERALGRIGPFLDLVRAGTRRNRCTWGFDLDQGPELMLPHLNELRFAGRALAAEGAIALADTNGPALVESIVAIDQLAAHTSGDGVLISSLVAMAINRLGDRLVDRGMRRGLIDAAGAARLADSSRRFATPGGFGVPGALRGEATLLVGWFENQVQAGPEARRELGEMLEMLGETASIQERLNAGEDRLVLQDAARMREVLNDAADLAQLPPSDAVQEDIDALSAKVVAGEAGDLATTLMASFERVILGRDRAMATAADRVETLEQAAQGELAVPLDAAAHYQIAMRRWLAIDPAVRLDVLSPAVNAVADSTANPVASPTASPANSLGAGEGPDAPETHAGSAAEAVAATAAAVDAVLDAVVAGAAASSFDAPSLRTRTDSLVLPAWTGVMAELSVVLRHKIAAHEQAWGAADDPAARASIAAAGDRLVTAAIGLAADLGGADVPAASTLAGVHLESLVNAWPASIGQQSRELGDDAAIARDAAVARLRAQSGLGFAASVERLDVPAAQAVSDVRAVRAGSVPANAFHDAESAADLLPRGSDERMALLMALERVAGAVGTPLVGPAPVTDAPAADGVQDPATAPVLLPGHERLVDVVALVRLRRGAAALRAFAADDTMDLTVWSDPTVRTLKFDERGRAAGEVVRRAVRLASVRGQGVGNGLEGDAVAPIDGTPDRGTESGTD
ncbi:MAG: hypothetical protein AB8G96_10890 [Phycisphaerales bacterium]